MKISIFPKVKALPTKEEKAKEARFASKPYEPEIFKVFDSDQLIDIVCNYAWSPSVFNGFRSQANFKGTDFMVLDIDDGMTIDDALDKVEELDITCLCMPSTSHTEDSHRFRLIFPLVKRISDKFSFSATMEKLSESFPVDPQTIGDTARMYFGCKPTDGFLHEGKLLEPVIPEKAKISPKKRLDQAERVEVGESLEELVEALYGEPKEEIPEQVAYWLKEAPSGLSGEWHTTCNSAIFTLGLQNVDFEAVETVFRNIAPEELDDHDEYLLQRAWNDGYNSREE